VPAPITLGRPSADQVHYEASVGGTYLRGNGALTCASGRASSARDVA
jgi:hypothetical protein